MSEKKTVYVVLFRSKRSKDSKLGIAEKFYDGKEAERYAAKISRFNQTFIKRTEEVVG